MPNGTKPPDNGDATVVVLKRRRKPLRGVVKQRTEDAYAKEVMALRLRTEGHTYDEIAKALGFSDHTGAWKAVQRARARVLAESMNEMREHDGMLLERMVQSFAPIALGKDLGNGVIAAPDADAGKMVLASLKQRAQLFGLNAPTRLQVENIDREQMEAEVTGLLTEVETLQRKRKKK